MSDAALALDGVERTFKQAGSDLHVLRGASVSIRRGETVALVGPSGAGKSTLLHIAGLLERPDGGDVIVGGTSCQRLGDDARTALRRTAIGFVYQFHHLLPEFSALENIVVPQMIAAAAKSAARVGGGGALTSSASAVPSATGFFFFGVFHVVATAFFLVGRSSMLA